MADPQQSPFGDMTALFEGLFGELFGRTSQHLHATLEINDAEAAAGVTREITVQRHECCTGCEGRGGRGGVELATCAGCQGAGKRTHTQGFFQVQGVCADCKGTGRALKNACERCQGVGTTVTPATVTIQVPAGSQHETSLVFEGKGSTLRDGTKGNLTVTLLVGGRPDSRLAAFGVGPDMASPFAHPLPEARLHNAKPRSITKLALPLLALLLGLTLLSFLLR